MYKKSKRLANENKHVRTSMIYGSQWDATLKWFLSSKDEKVRQYVTDSTGKGNHKGTNGNKAIATGSNENYKANNIYDMAGNVYDWTIETNGTDNRIIRGGYYSDSGSDCPASYRIGTNPTYIVNNFRMQSRTLYVILSADRRKYLELKMSK